MEDAAKALLIAAGFMIGIMIISLGITLATSLSKYSDDAQKRIEENALQSFNNQFIKYINCDNNGNIKFELTIHDIITVANMAYEKNTSYELDQESNNNYYISVKIENDNIEKSIFDDPNCIKTLLNNYSDIKFRCSTQNVKINSNTGRIYEITFIKI